MTKLRLDIISSIFSLALDIVEAPVTNSTLYHGMRLAVLACEMGKRLGYSEQTLLSLEIAALFHDNSVSQYAAIRKGENINHNLREHCIMGAENLKWLPFHEEVGEIIVHHHEHTHGSGAFGKRKGEYSRKAAILALVDYVDTLYHVHMQYRGSVPLFKDIIHYKATKGFDKEDTELLADILDEKLIASLQDNVIVDTFRAVCPAWEVDASDDIIFHIGEMFGKIIDFKSHFTNTHTKRIANAVYVMGKYYGYDKPTLHKLHLAASLHDIGKMLIPTNILEKPDKLTKEEYIVIKHHMDITYNWLLEIPNFSDGAAWAANHHEKLIGGGYPRGIKASELDFNCRLMACIDIWEALTAHRPYQKTFYNHAQAMDIMKKQMADKQFIDAKITQDVDKVLGEFDGKKIPSPLGGFNY
jgi:HD-GYP domain-containing protein (c-di-GMP phosphodiesterase class II)